VFQCYYERVTSASLVASGHEGVSLARLRTPPPRRIVPDGVFDAFSWCESDTLDWRRPRWYPQTPLDDTNPARMVFVMHRLPDGSCAGAFLPRELARLHAPDLGLTDDEALAPWAIDDATDELWAHRVRPRDVFWLAADNVNALFWGLHDWAHFHSHGPFDQRAWTELQCDATALAWLWANRDVVPDGEGSWERVRQDAVALSRARFASEARELDEALLEARFVQELVVPLPRTARS
jgi:hypothetical protein